MDNLFDELAKCLSGQISRRSALKRCGAILAVAVGALGLRSKARGDLESDIAACIENCCHGLIDDARMDCNLACQEAEENETAVCLGSSDLIHPGTCAFCTAGQVCSSTGTCVSTIH
jgi:hypothetical protein